jgi:predicted rRNA methylase YqxC with S4 and FtsJ domains
MLKYCINVVPMILGGIIFVPSIFNMFSIIKIMGENAIVDISFIKSKNIFIASLVIILAMLLMAVCLTVFKPKLKVQRNNRQFSVI